LPKSASAEKGWKISAGAKILKVFY